MKTFSSKLFFYVKKVYSDPRFLNPQFLQYCFNDFINRYSFCFCAIVSDETMA